MQPNKTSQSATLQRAPEPQVSHISELANRILTGDILLPKFQRDFVWDKKQIIDLLDSIANGYPIGSVLLWRSREQLRSERNIADLQIAPTQVDYPVNYLLDGQQRLSTICGALYWKGGKADSRWNIVYDLRDKKFIHSDSLDDPPLHQIRMNRWPDASAWFRHSASLDILQASDVPTLKDNMDSLFNRFKDYKVAMVTLHDMSIQAVAPIFERINSKGTPLTVVDLMRAATWSEGFDLIDGINDITDELDEKSFGGIDRKAILRSISAAAGGGFPEFSIDALRKHSPELLTKAMADTKKAYLKAVDFMATELHIPGDQYLPYINQVVVLSELFRLLKSPTHSQLSETKKWFWRTAASGYFGGWNTGNMTTDQAAVSAFAEGGASDIYTPAAPPNLSLWTTQQFRSNSAHSKILVLLLSFNRPLDLLTGQKIDAERALFQGNLREFHHFFPRDYLITRGVSVRRASALANFVMLTASSNKIITNRAPSDYLKDVRAHLGSNLGTALSANLISDAAFSAALADDYDTFLNERAKTIQETVGKLAGW